MAVPQASQPHPASGSTGVFRVTPYGPVFCIVAVLASRGTTLIMERGKAKSDFPVLDSRFFVREDGAAVADVLFSAADETGQTWYFWYRLADAGEPGRRTDTWQTFFWADFRPGSGFLPDGYPTSWPPVFIAGLIPGVPKWYPYSGHPRSITPGSIQVHITDAYVP